MVEMEAWCKHKKVKNSIKCFEFPSMMEVGVSVWMLPSYIKVMLVDASYSSEIEKSHVWLLALQQRCFEEGNTCQETTVMDTMLGINCYTR